MRYSTTLPKTMLRLFDAFGKVDASIVSQIPFLITGDPGSGFRCTVGVFSSRTVQLTILRSDGRLFTSYGPAIEVSIESEAEVTKTANDISEKCAAAAAKFCEEHEYSSGEPVDRFAYDGDEIRHWLQSGEPPDGWLSLANEANTSVRERLLRLVEPEIARLIRSSSLTFCHLNLFGTYAPDAEQSIRNAVKEIPALIGPIFLREDFLEEFNTWGNVGRTLDSLYNVGENSYRVLGLLQEVPGRKDSYFFTSVVAAFGHLPNNVLNRVQDANTAERLWRVIDSVVGNIMWAFSPNHDDVDEYTHQSKGVGLLAVRILHRDGTLSEVLDGGDPVRWITTKETDPFRDICDFVFQVFVLPHLPTWMFDPLERAPEQSERLLYTVGSNLLLWAGVKEIVDLSNGWTDYYGEIGTWPRDPDEDDLREKCVSLLDRIMPGAGTSERAWILVSNLDAMNCIDSFGPREEEVLEAAE